MMHDLPNNPFSSNPEPPDPPPRRLHDEDFHPGMCWHCFRSDEEEWMRLIHITEIQYGPLDGGHCEEEDWDLECYTCDQKQGHFSDPYSYAEHALGVLRVNTEGKTNQWLIHTEHFQKHYAYWENRVEQEKLDATTNPKT